MAVYTEVTDEDLTAFLDQYDLGEVTAFKGIAEGVENSNYLLRTTMGSYILTLYEKRVRPEDLPYFVGLMEHLARNGIDCPVPIHGRDDGALRELCGRPAAIVSFLDGLSPRRVKPEHCRLLGEAMAHMHLAGSAFEMRRENDLSMPGWRPLTALRRNSRNILILCWHRSPATKTRHGLNCPKSTGCKWSISLGKGTWAVCKAIMCW